ncbi:VIT domain-containing protein [Fimbriiglobus ruber]|uniref:VIT domain-containing protein n=1 Tax=Fimbriiglobus ruber TaxID=1908690 RepID=A0A225E410_9BACT|nr:VIT domain-containing protein [Fimbriiglobus ruber]OWK43137.1 hypothetical protein FRUB_02736 [Fimbriiglobus ruber]
MTPPDHTPDDDERLADLLAAAGADAPPPDPAFLAWQRDLSTEAFLATHSGFAPNPSINGDGTTAVPPAGAEIVPPITPSSLAPNRRRKMFSVLVKLTTAAIAAAVLVATGVHFWPSGQPEARLAQVLDRAADAETLHLQVITGDTPRDVWVAHPDRIRWDDSADRYQIARGDLVYTIDEKANRATVVAKSYFRPDRRGLNLFALVNVSTPSPDRVRVARSERIERDGATVDRFYVSCGGEEAVIEADALTGDLRSVQTFELGRGGRHDLVATFVVLAQNAPVPAEKFVVADTLSEDGRVGKVADVQGVVSIKPMTAQRWTPVRPNAVLLPGDWVRADLRGANAASLKLLPRATVVVGPGGLLEVVKPTQLRLHEGEVEITPAKNTPVELLGPGDQKIVVKEKTHYRVEKEQFVQVTKEPVWLKGFKGTSANESLGELVAKVDGRNVPLTVGYHKVSVDIRDQIARTTIEESFVNHTNAQLEGTFHFPLPQDASISGFAMWIGNEMVEADVVEKQRAREIYEEIMREKRDPGLLEWAGGNVFKARVWPIFPHSEKRIRITYTQVLPLKANRYRYSYALQSEMLQQHPLRDLSIDVTVASAAPLKSVLSPTHVARASKTDHAAKLEFSAQEYTPIKDFEVVVDVAAAAPEVVVVPHRRGADGYFLAQVTPPAGDAAERDTLPDGNPLELVLVCDTSASVDPHQRSTQTALAASLLGALTPADTFNLATCDVAAEWVFDRTQPATPDNVRKATAFLAGRTSLGWTDLDTAFAAAFKQCGPKGHVVYLGDGISTTGDANPQALAARVQALYTANGTTAAVHTVALGSTFEPGVMRTLSRLGGGSFRRVTTEQGPTAVALELLGELTRPPVRDLKVEFRGWQTARVYPETLANLSPGTQQILTGRYLPEGKDQTGEVVVTGSRDGKEVKYTAKAILKDAESGNSFIPRLWARAHLDKLLEQPQTPAVRDDVIALSEEFHIMTPYTSFLVLESDADRARFKVQRRFQMRDGEQFFAKGRDDAGYALAREQMKRAGTWRAGLRRNALAALSLLGRSPNDVRGIEKLAKALLAPTSSPSTAYPYYEDGPVAGLGRNRYAESEFEELGAAARESGEYFGGLAERNKGLVDDLAPISDTTRLAGMAGRSRGLAPGFLPRGDIDDDFFADKDAKSLGDLSDKKALGFKQLRDAEAFDALPDLETFDRQGLEFDSRSGVMPISGRRMLHGGFGGGGFARSPQWRTVDAGIIGGLTVMVPHSYSQRAPQQTQWFNPLFPELPVPVAAPKAAPKSDWPQDARDLARSVWHSDALAKIAGGLRIERKTESFRPAENVPSGHERDLELYSPGGWVTQYASDAGRSVIEWCDGKERGTYTRAFLLGRVRPSLATDLRAPAFDLPGHSLAPLDETYAHLTAAVEKADGGMVLVLKQTAQNNEIRYSIDTDKRAVTRIEHRTAGKPSTTTTYGDFVEAGGLWWPRRTETVHPEYQRRPSVRVIQTVTALTADEFAAQVKQTLADRPNALLLRTPGPTVLAAKKALAAGKATADDEFTLLNFYAAFQQWAKASEHLAALEKRTADKPGARWLRTAVLAGSRRNEELRRRLLDEADQTARLPAGGDRVAIATYLLSQSQSALSYTEQLDVLDRLAVAYAGLPKSYDAFKQWKQQRAQALAVSGRPDKAIALRKELAEENPGDESLQVQYANELFQRGDHEAAFAWLKKLFAAGGKEHLRAQYADWLEQLNRFTDLAAFTADWAKVSPNDESVYKRQLSALIYGGAEAQANELIAKWLTAAQVKGDVAPAAVARFRAAAATAGGSGHNINADRIDPRWIKPLATAARFFIGHPKHGDLTLAVLFTNRFNLTDEGLRVREDLFRWLIEHVSTLPVPQLAEQIRSAVSYPTTTDKAVWVKLTNDIRTRWAAEKDSQLKDQLGGVIEMMMTQRIGGDEYRDFLRERYKAATERTRDQYASQLFQSLISTTWTAEHETEALSLARTPVDIYTLTDRMVQGRYEVLQKTITSPEKLTRTELAKKRAELLTQARTEYADRLKDAGKTLPADLQPWAAIDRLYLLTRAGVDAKPLAAECWAFLGATPPKSADEGEATPAQQLAEILRHRYLSLALYFAAQSGAAPDLTDRALKYLDAGAAADADNPFWRAVTFQLLVALERPKELEAALTTWVAAGDADGRWRTALGYVRAELGQLKEAIALLETVRHDGDLGPADYRALAGWYMAVNDRAAHEKALVDALKSTDENTLSYFLQGHINAWRNGGAHAPTALDANVIRAFAVVFEKSASPQNYQWLLREAYLATHDFRLLAAVCDSVVGQSAGKIYPFLLSLQTVFNEIRDEAVVDEMAARIDTLRATTKTPTDARALDLLEMQVRRRAAELKNQPGPHADRALAALKRAYARPWADGERLLMGDLLRGLGRIAHADLAAEQRRELHELHAAAAPATLDRLRLAQSYATTLGSYDRHAEGAVLLDADLAAFVKASDGITPDFATSAVTDLVNLHEGARQYAQAEALLQQLAKNPTNEQQKIWFDTQLDELYSHAIRADATVALGTGEALYKALERRMVREAAATYSHNRYQVISRLCTLYQTAHEKKYPGQNDLLAFSRNDLPGLLKMQGNLYHQIVSVVAQRISALHGPQEIVDFLVTRIEQEPSWLRWNNQDGWSQHHWMLAQHRTAAKNLPAALDARLLKLVLTRLREDLINRVQRYQTMCYAHNGYYWAEKEPEFVQVAEEVYAAQKTSVAAVRYIADYFARGCNHRDRAIEILFAAHEKKLLDEGGLTQLVNVLREAGRYGEQIPILTLLIGMTPDNVWYRTELCRAYIHTGRLDDRATAFAAAEAHFRAKDRWTEDAMAPLALVATDTQLYDRGVAISGELIPLCQRSGQARQHGTLSGYYQVLARAQAGLGHTAEAVDAASGAIVSWGSDVNNRANALNELRNVIAASPNLDGFVAHLDAKTAETGLLNPIVRKAVGQVYHSQSKFPQAIAQLQLAMNAQPNDAETLNLLIDCFDKMKNPDGAIGQILRTLELSRRDIKRYEDLGKRYETTDRRAEAERAYTSIVEVTPNESEGHTLLAQIRERQGRWADAIGQWEQVARIRALEPDGLLGLAAAQLHEKQYVKAAETMEKLKARTWPPHAANAPGRIAELDRQLREGQLAK